MGFALISCVTILVVGSVQAVVEYSQVNNGNAAQKTAVLRREAMPTKPKIHETWRFGGWHEDESPDPDEDDDSDEDDEKKMAWHESSDPDGDDEMKLEDDEKELQNEGSKVARKVKKSQTSMDKDGDLLFGSNNSSSPPSSSDGPPESSGGPSASSDATSFSKNGSGNSSSSPSDSDGPPESSGGPSASSDATTSFSKNGSDNSSSSPSDSDGPPESSGGPSAAATSFETPSEKRHRIEREAYWAEKIERLSNKLEEAAKSMKGNSKEKKIQTPNTGSDSPEV